MNNIDKNEDFWFYLEPYVYINVIDNQGLIYNTLDSKTIIVNNPIILNLITSLFLKENCGVIKISSADIKNIDIYNFIVEIRKNFMGDIIKINDIDAKPIQIVPLLNLQRDIKRMQKEFGMDYKASDISYINSISVFLDYDLNKSHQFIKYFTKHNMHAKDLGNNIILLDTLWKFLYPLSAYGLNNLEIIICNHSLYTKPNELKDSVLKLAVNSYILLSYNNLSEINADIFKIENLNFKILIDFPVIQKSLKNFIQCLNSENIKRVEFVFQITSKYDYYLSNKIIKENAIKNYIYQPIYTGGNIGFFENYIFLSEKDIVSTPISRREIFMRQVINSFDFGRLIILANGDIYSNLLGQKLGNIISNTVFEVIHKELTLGTNWLNCRSSKPCNKCIYQYLCPSPSNYESVIDRSNLCHVKFEV